MRVVLAGASGLIGTALRESLLADGHAVTVLVRRTPSAPDEAEWHPERGELDPAVLTGADAVVCLSGAGVGDKRWTDDYKRTILASRVDSVATIARGLTAEGTPRTFVAASAVGYDGDTGDSTVDESAPAGDSFLADVCVRWEAAAAPAVEAGARVVHLRSGLVLSSAGGLLKQLVPIVKAGVAGPLGSGRQFMPWISLADEVAAIRFLIDHDVPGAVNLTGPEPVRNREFIATLGRLLHRPTGLPTPGFALRLVLGEFAQETLAGQRALPAKLVAAGFTFTHADHELALRWALDRSA